MIIYVISGFFILTTIVFGFLFFRTNHKLTKLANSLYSNQRIGYYDIIKTGYGSYVARIYVSEEERYTNGKSKLKLLRTEFVSGYKDDYHYFIKNSFSFVELKDTNAIDWLIVEEDIKQQRLKKLKELGL
jgi:hypothetical protein